MGKSLIKTIRAILRFLNIVFRFIFGKNIMETRNSIRAHRDEILRGGYVFLAISIALPLLSLALGCILGALVSDAVGHVIVSIGFIHAAIAWIILALTLSAILKSTSLLTSVFKVFEQTVDLKLDQKTVENFFSNSFNVITWLMIATLYTSIIPIWNSFTGLVILIVIILFFVVAAAGKWVTPNPKTLQAIWKGVFVLFIITTLRFVPDGTWIQATNHPKPNWFKFTNTMTHAAIKEAENLIDETKDQITAQELEKITTQLKRAIQRNAPSDSIKQILAELEAAKSMAEKKRGAKSIPTRIKTTVTDILHDSLDNSPVNLNAPDTLTVTVIGDQWQYAQLNGRNIIVTPSQSLVVYNPSNHNVYSQWGKWKITYEPGWTFDNFKTNEPGKFLELKNEDGFTGKTTLTIIAFG